MRKTVVVIGVLIGIMLAGCGQREEADVTPAAVPAVQARLVDVAVVDIPLEIEATGRVASALQATLSSKIPGTIRVLHVREGGTVRKEQTIVELDSRDLDAALAAAEAEFQNTRINLARMKPLYRDQAVSKQELDEAERAFKVAEARRRAARAQLSYTVVKAPFDGVVSRRLVEVGEMASPGQPLLKLEDPARLRLEATVSETDVKAVAVGAAIRVVIDALGSSPVTGTVAKILPAGDPRTHTFLVKVDLPVTPGLKAGMFGRMLVEKGTIPAIVVPANAVVTRGELTGVYVVGPDPDNVARLRWVKTGRPVATGVEVLSGLTAGERIIADASRGMEGARVTEDVRRETVDVR